MDLGFHSKDVGCNERSETRIYDIAESMIRDQVNS